MSEENFSVFFVKQGSKTDFREQMAWFLFLKMDSVLVGDLTPPLLMEFIEEFWATPTEKMVDLLREEYREEDLPDCLRRVK